MSTDSTLQRVLNVVIPVGGIIVTLAFLWEWRHVIVVFVTIGVLVYGYLRLCSRYPRTGYVLTAFLFGLFGGRR
jgi:hypothetical protein